MGEYKQLNEEYFQPLNFREKRNRGQVNKRKCDRPSKLQGNYKMQDISIKIAEMSKMVHSQDK